MPCDHARRLMGDRLDGEAVPELDAHLRDCVACASELARLADVDALLKAQQLVELPPNFSSRMMHRLAEADRRRPDWRRGLIQIGAVMSGTLAAAAGGGLLLNGWRWTMVGTPLSDQATMIVRSVPIVIVTVLESSAHGAVRWPVYGVLAAALAAAWFGALVVPRLGERTAR